MRILGLLSIFLFLIVLQAVFLQEAFASSQGGAQVQLVASRPVYYLAGVPAWDGSVCLSVWVMCLMFEGLFTVRFVSIKLAWTDRGWVLAGL